MMKKTFLFLFLFSISIIPLFAQEPERLDLEKAVQTGLERNFGIKIAENNLNIAQRDIKIGVGTFFVPVFDAVYANTFAKEDVLQKFITNPESPNEIDGAESRTSNYSVVAFYGFRPETIWSIRRLGVLADISELDAKVMVENTVAAISSAYYRLVLELQRYNVLKTTLELSQSRLDIAKARYELGGAGRRDFLTAQVDYNADLSLLINQELVIRNAKINVNELLALPPETDFFVKDSITVTQKLDYQELLENAYTNNKLFLQTQRRENEAYLSMKETQALRLPELRFDGSYINNTFRSDAGFLLENRRSGFGAGATISLNLFTGFTVNRRIQNAKVQRINAELAVKELEIQMNADLQRAFNIYQNNIILLDIEYDNYQVAIENADIALERFRLGISDYLQFRDAQLNLLTAEDRLITALFNIKEMEIELMRLSGRIFYQDDRSEFKLTLD